MSLSYGLVPHLSKKKKLSKLPLFLIQISFTLDSVTGSGRELSGIKTRSKYDEVHKNKEQSQTRCHRTIPIISLLMLQDFLRIID